MDYQRAISLLNDVEDALPVSTWRVHGVQLWPIVRSRVFWSLFDNALGTGWERGGTPGRILRRARSAARSIGSTRRDILRGVPPDAPADAIIVTDGVAAAQVDGRAFDVIADPIAELISGLGHRVGTWYTTYACPEPRQTPGSLVQWRLDLAQIAHLVNQSRTTAKPQSLQGYDAFLERLRAADAPVQAASLERMSRLAWRVAVMAERFEGWLKSAEPRLAFVNCYYSLEGAALMLACKRREVLTIDLQHGVQGPLHVAYGRWANVPPEGYDLLPRRFWCWSESDVEWIRSWMLGQSAHVPLWGGNPWLDMWYDANAPLVVRSGKDIDRIRREGTRAILVTLQWGMTDETFLLPLIELIAASNGSWTWWLRLHPVMKSQRDDVRMRLRARGVHNAFLDEPSDLALPALLRCADVHLTHSSSATLEAAAFGVPSVLTSPNGAACFPELSAEGVVTQISSLAPENAMPALDLVGAAARKAPPRTPSPARATLAALLTDRAIPATPAPGGALA